MLAHTFSKEKQLPSDIKSSASTKVIKNILDFNLSIKMKISDYLTTSELSKFSRVDTISVNSAFFVRALYGSQYTFEDPKKPELETYFLSAVYVYQMTMQHAKDTNPAIIYKMSHPGREAVTISLEKERHGRVYMPLQHEDDKDQYHSWPVNLVWVYAQGQVGRDFFIQSPLWNKYIFRYKYPEIYSAFVKEMAAMIKIGYKPHFDPEEKHPNYIRLLCPKDKTALRRLKICDLDVSTADVQSAIDLIKPLQAEKDMLLEIKPYLFSALQNDRKFSEAWVLKSSPQPADPEAEKAWRTHTEFLISYRLRGSKDCYGKLISYKKNREFLLKYTGLFKTVAQDLAGFINKQDFFSEALKKELIEDMEKRSEILYLQLKAI